MTIQLRNVARLLAIGSAALFVAACSSDGNKAPPPPPPPPPPPAMVSFDVTVTNLTNAQPLSPVAVIAHQDLFSVFAIGSPATVGLETLAEGGDNSALIAEASAVVGIGDTASGAAAIGPAGSETVSVSFEETALASMTLSVSTMLVNTNDAITGVKIGRAHV